VTSAAEGLPAFHRRVGRSDGGGRGDGGGRARRTDRGELAPMSPKGNQHEVVKVALLDRWRRARSDEVLLAPETAFRLNEDTYLEPDIVIFPRERNPRPCRRQRPPRRGDRRLVAALRHWAQAAALRQFRHPGTLGYRRGPTDDAGFPEAGRGWLPRGPRFWRSRAPRASVRGSCICAETRGSRHK
jgi:hypothetical protein